MEVHITSPAHGIVSSQAQCMTNVITFVLTKRHSVGLFCCLNFKNLGRWKI